MKTQCVRCKGEAELRDNLEYGGNKCSTTATCIDYDCSGTQVHKFECSDDGCSYCGSSVYLEKGFLELQKNVDMLSVTHDVECSECGEDRTLIFFSIGTNLI